MLIFILLLSLIGAFPASAQEVSTDQVFATVGRCTIEVEYLRKALAEAKTKIAELTKPPPEAPAK